ncbi:hypothetical protein BRD09_05690 [Halobacteriales archaeon SW_10_68_16]|jgi:uncharacterized paraquat-inducible protein A|nr:MAG: hypothetical protein BRD09_05690 [Halobacteriales archaeon SW_10_68_16]
MVPWIPFLSYLLICVLAALLGWLPFRLLERYSLVEEVEPTRRAMDRTASSPGAHCVSCGATNEGAYSYCRQCGRRLPAG